MEFKKDFKIKPKEVNLNGLVTFTDGTNDVVPNQLACEAYGYHFNQDTGVCSAFPNFNVNAVPTMSSFLSKSLS